MLTVPFSDLCLLKYNQSSQYMWDSLLKCPNIVCVVCAEEYKHKSFLGFRNKISMFDLRGDLRICSRII